MQSVYEAPDQGQEAGLCHRLAQGGCSLLGLCVREDLAARQTLQTSFLDPDELSQLQRACLDTAEGLGGQTWNQKHAPALINSRQICVKKKKDFNFGCVEIQQVWKWKL